MLYADCSVLSHTSFFSQVIGSFSQAFCFPRAVAYLDGGKVNVKGMVTDVFKLEEYQAALDKMSSRGALKIAITP